MSKANFKADLHCHSTCSDGTHTPEQLVQMAKKIGLQGLAITDHDTIKGCASALAEGKKLQVELISGVEFSAVHAHVSIHILGYAFNPQHPSITQFCERHQRRRAERNFEILALLKMHGMPITEEELKETTLQHSLKQSVGRPHIALAMIKKGYVQNMQEAFQKYLGEEMPCYAMGEAISVEEAIQTIKEANGFAILAHPHLLKPSQEQLLAELLELPLDGIEVYYGRHNAQQNQPWIQLAKQKKLLMTGGSDFHGDTKPNSFLGSSWVDEEIFRLLHTRFQKNCER